MDFELYINWGVVGIIVLIALVIALLAANIKVVPQAHAFVIERLGAYHATWSTGLHLKIPFIDRIAKKVSLKEQVIDFPPQPVITKDNVTMQIDTVVYFQITDSKLYAYGVERPISAIENLSATTLRNIIGEMELDHTLTSRDVINSKIRVILDEATDAWGIKVKSCGAEKHHSAEGNSRFDGEADEGGARAPCEDFGRRGRKTQRHPHCGRPEGICRSARGGCA